MAKARIFAGFFVVSLTSAVRPNHYEKGLW